MKPIISKLLTSIFLVSSFSAFAQQDVKVTAPKPATGAIEQNRVISGTRHGTEQTKTGSSSWST